MISELTDIEYLIAFSDGRTALSDACVRQASEGGRLYCERAGDSYRGFLCTETEGRTARILYAYTKPEFRGRGIFTSLAEHVVQTAEGEVRVPLRYAEQIINLLFFLLKEKGGLCYELCI